MTEDLKITPKNNTYNYTDYIGCSVSTEWNFPEYQGIGCIASLKGDGQVGELLRDSGSGILLGRIIIIIIMQNEVSFLFI